MQDPVTERSEVIPLKPEQQETAVKVLTQAFQADPMFAQIIPDPDLRARSMPALWEASVDYCYRYGHVFTTPQVAGVACWLPPGRTAVTFWRLLRAGMKLPRAMMRLPREGRRRFSAVLGYGEALQKQLDSDHWYLWALAVTPDVQGQGIGSCLLQPVLTRADNEQAVCYLETESEGNVSFYRKHGFEVVTEGDVPGHGIRLWTMLREPGDRT